MLIYSSRLFVGASHAMLTTSIYAIEITTKETRAAFNFFEGVPRCIGSIIVYICAMFLRWQQIANFSWTVPLFALVCLQFCPESPVFLINQGKQSELYEVLKKLNGDNDPCFLLEEEDSFLCLAYRPSVLGKVTQEQIQSSISCSFGNGNQFIPLL